jgi:hypothetical protein
VEKKGSTESFGEEQCNALNRVRSKNILFSANAQRYHVCLFSFYPIATFMHTHIAGGMKSCPTTGLSFSTLVLFNTVQYSTVQYSTVQCSAVQHSTVKCSTVEYSSAQHSFFS